MIETEKQKYIKEKYFVLNSHDPLNYYPITDKKLLLNPFNVIRIIDLIIKILDDEEEKLREKKNELFEKLQEDIRKGNFIQRNFGETDEEFRIRVLEKSKKVGCNG